MVEKGWYSLLKQIIKLIENVFLSSNLKTQSINKQFNNQNKESSLNLHKNSVF